MKRALLSKCHALVVLLLMPTIMLAQADVVDVDSIGEDSLMVTQYDFDEFDRVDFCHTPQYVIVTKNGRKGIYDMYLHQNITELEYRELRFNKLENEGDSLESCWFYGKKGYQWGIISVFSEDNSIMSIWMNDPGEIYSLDECTTIDKRMEKRTKKLLKRFIQAQRMDNAQLVILDAQTGRLKTWVAMDADMKKDGAGMLLAHSCSASLTTPFRDGRPPKNKQLDATSPFMMAVGYNGLAHHGALIIPTMKGDSVEVEASVYTETDMLNIKERLRVNHAEFSSLSWLTNATEWYGYAAIDNIYEIKDKERKEPIGKQIQFSGMFPVDNPRYTICIVAEKHSLDVAPIVFQEVVNPLAMWLLSKMK